MTPDLPQFTEVDLTKTTKRGSDEIQPGLIYLALIDGIYRVGKFSPVWFGLNFNSGANNFQYDPPGTNASHWQRLWRFDNAEEILQTQKVIDALLEGTN